jgi:hypothetical protein
VALHPPDCLFLFNRLSSLLEINQRLRRLSLISLLSVTFLRNGLSNCSGDSFGSLFTFTKIPHFYASVCTCEAALGQFQRRDTQYSKGQLGEGDVLISSTTGIDIFLNGTGQITPLFFKMPCRAKRTVIIADLSTTE